MIMKSANQALKDRTSVASTATARGLIKSILFAVHEDDQLEQRLQAALSLARACSAHLQLLHILPVQAYAVVDVYGGTFASGSIMEALEDQGAKTRARIERKIAIEDVSWSYELVTSATVPELRKNAAFADLIIIGRSPPFHEFSRTGPGLLGEILCNTRSPLCVPGDEATSFDPFGNALIAWNGSIEGANAVRSAIGLLSMARHVRVVRFTEDKEVALPDLKLLEYLSRHGVHAEIETHMPRGEIGDDLIEHAKRIGAEYVVTGSYSHSRAGEFLFGGVTRDLLRECRISLVMGH